MRKDAERNQDPNSQKAKKIDVVEERLVVDKEKIDKGKVVLHKRVIEEDIPLDLNLTEEHIDVEVKKIGEVVDKPGPAMREEGDTTIYSVYREVYVKQTILEEEVRITKKRTNRPYHSSEKLRREVIDVERVSGEPQDKDRDRIRDYDDENRIAERRYNDGSRDQDRDRAGDYDEDKISERRYDDELRDRDRQNDNKDPRNRDRTNRSSRQGDYPGYNEQGDVTGYDKLKE